MRLFALLAAVAILAGVTVTACKEKPAITKPTVAEKPLVPDQYKPQPEGTTIVLTPPRPPVYPRPFPIDKPLRSSEGCQCVNCRCRPKQISRESKQPAAVAGFVWANGVEFIPGKNWIFNAPLGQQPIRHRWELWPEALFTKEELDAKPLMAPNAAAYGSACSGPGCNNK